MAFPLRAATILFLATCLLAAPFFLSAYYLRVGALICVNGLAVTGLVILSGWAGQVSLGHAGFVGIGGYACGLFPKYFDMHAVAGGIVGAAISAIVAGVVGRPILRLQGHYLAVASLGFGILISMVLANEVAITGGPDGLRVPDIGLRASLADLGLPVSNAALWYWVSALSLAIGVWLALNLKDSPSGRALRALHGSETAAAAAGIDVAGAKLKAFVISAVYASLAGSLLALQNRMVTPDIAGYTHSIELVTMAVLGGVASVPGAISGAAMLTLLPQLFTAFDHYEQLMLGLVMMVVMIAMPSGVLPGVHALLRNHRR